MTRRATSVKCVLWYIGTTMLVPLCCLAEGIWERVWSGVIGLPAAWLFGLTILVGLGDWADHHSTFVIVLGYFVQISLAIGATYAREHDARYRFYLTFIFLLLLDLCVMFLVPLLVFLRGGPAE